MVAVAACTANAVAAALKPLGIEVRDLPLSPARIWELVNGGDLARKS
jgi:carbon-monoxide dehydrogenase large subunit